MKFNDRPWWVRVVAYGAIFGVLVILLEPYKTVGALILKGVIAGVVLIVLFAPVMRWSSRRKARKAAEPPVKRGSVARADNGTNELEPA